MTDRMKSITGGLPSFEPGVNCIVNLKPVEIGILALSPCEWTGEDQKIAHRLVKKGYLVADLSEPSAFRRTPEGETELRKLVGNVRE